MRFCFDLYFYLLLDPVLCGDVQAMMQTALAAMQAGATMIQLRDKKGETCHIIKVAQQLRQLLEGSRARLIINDNVEAAICAKADGVHLGQDDMRMTQARQRLGEDMILGLSVETEELAAAVSPFQVDYVGIGPVFATPTKPDHKPPLGFNGLARLVTFTPVPAVAIGGLKAAHAQSVFATGAQGMAVISAICGQDDLFKEAQIINQEIERAKM